MRRRGSGALGRLSLDPPLAVSLLQDSAVPELKGQRGRQVGPPQRSPSIATRAPSDTGLPPSCCRDFVMSSYQELKKANPTFPILIRECSGIEAKMVARYGAPPPPACVVCPHGVLPLVCCAVTLGISRALDGAGLVHPLAHCRLLPPPAGGPPPPPNPPCRRQTLAWRRRCGSRAWARRTSASSWRRW